MKVVITGANRGIGLALCRELKEKNFVIFALCRKNSPELSELGITVIEKVDVTDRESLKNAAKQLENEQIDLLINNAGIKIDDTIDTLQHKNLLQQYEVNTLGPLWVSLAFLSLMKNPSKIIFISSRAGSIGDNPAPRNFGYRISKAALNMLGVMLSNTLVQKNIALGLLHPGFVQTDMTSKKGDLSPEQSAKNLVHTIEKINSGNSGKFWHCNGQELPW